MAAYDVVIIGSGLGGLLSAVLLAREGRSVAVIEQNKQVGGCLQTFSFDKKVFDSCVHYIGSMDEGQVQRRIFDYVGISKELKLNKLDQDCFDGIAFGNEETIYPLAQGMDNLVEQLTPYFSEERGVLQQYIQLLEQTAESFPLFNLRNGTGMEKERVLHWGLQEVMSRMGSKKLQQVLMGNNLLYAGSESSTPFYVHSLVSKSYVDSAYKCVGGSSQIAKLLWRKLQEYGGVIFRNEKVCQLIESGGVLTQAITERGSVFEGKQFIANVHPASVLGWIDSKLIRPVYRKRITTAANSISAFLVNIVLLPGKVPYPNSNIYWNRNDDVFAALRYKAGEWPANYALYYNEDPARPGYAESVALLTYMHVGEWDQWKHTYNSTAQSSQREAGYHHFKTEKAHTLIDTVAQRFPEIRQQLYSFQVATPLTFRDYMGTPDGSIYGIMNDVQQPEQTRIPVRTKIPNLLLTGQNVGLHGILGVSINAIAVCGELLGLDYLLNKINSNAE